LPFGLGCMEGMKICTSASGSGSMDFTALRHLCVRVSIHMCTFVMCTCVLCVTVDRRKSSHQLELLYGIKGKWGLRWSLIEQKF
jgi:hypothetical protein